MHPLVDQPIPGLSLFELKQSVAENAPLAVKCRAAVTTVKIGLQRLFKAAPEDHGCPSLFLTPAVQIAIPIAAWAAEILGNLGVAIGHLGFSLSHRGRSTGRKVRPTRPSERTLRGSDRNARVG